MKPRQGIWINKSWQNWWGTGVFFVGFGWLWDLAGWISRKLCFDSQIFVQKRNGYVGVYTQKKKINNMLKPLCLNTWTLLPSCFQNDKMGDSSTAVLSLLDQHIHVKSYYHEWSIWNLTWGTAWQINNADCVGLKTTMQMPRIKRYVQKYNSQHSTKCVDMIIHCWKH